MKDQSLYYYRLLFILIFGLFSGCTQFDPPTLIIVPQPRDPITKHTASLSQVAAEEVLTAVRARGYAALFPDVKTRPETCIISNDGEGNSGLKLYIWVQAVHLPLPHFPGETPRTFGGMSIYDSHGQELASSRFTLEIPDQPVNRFYRVAHTFEPAASEAARAFAQWISGDPNRFAEQLSRNFDQ